MKNDLSETWIDPRIEIRGSPVEGRGMFATAPIKAGEKAVVFGGVYTEAVGAAQARKENKLVMQWDDDLYSVEEHGDDDSYFINHSCDPNIWMQDAYTLVARRDIQKGEEITADYALWEADANYVSKWECRCNSPRCRKRVTGEDWQSKELQERYNGHFSPLLI
jgi:SET domain-containing protein